jgi:ABC-2 type transport system ATP-binding protein
MASTEVAAIETRGLWKRFPMQAGWRNLFRPSHAKVALEDVTVSVARGEAFGLLGPNGAGKTTLIKILCTLIRPTAGEARVSGLDVVSHDGQVRGRIGLVYGDARSFFWRLSLRENMRFYAALYGIHGAAARRRTDELVETVGLSDAADLRMHYFSSGMKQRAAIARGLLSDPEVIFLDEPTTSVDPVGAHEIRKMIRERLVEHGGRTLVLTTNVMEEAELLCDRVGLLDRGRLELVGDVDTLRRRFQPDERYCVTVSPVDRYDLRDLLRVPGVLGLEFSSLRVDRSDLVLTVRSNSHAIPHVLRRLAEESVDVWSCAKRELSLDEMFRLQFGSKSVEAIRTVGAQPAAARSVP